MNCNERYYELIGEIIAYPENAIQFTTPFNLPGKKYITPSEYTITELEKLLLPMKKKSGSLKETPQVSVAGESYETKVSWTVENVTAEVYDTLERLKTGPHHLIVNTFGDNPMLIRAVEYAYNFAYKENDGNLSCELTIINVNGTQRVL